MSVLLVLYVKPWSFVCSLLRRRPSEYSLRSQCSNFGGKRRLPQFQDCSVSPVAVAPNKFPAIKTAAAAQTGGLRSLQERGRDSCLRAVLRYKRIFTSLKACMGCKRFFIKGRKNVMFLNKIDLPICLVVFFVVCPRLRPFWKKIGDGASGYLGHDYLIKYAYFDKILFRMICLCQWSWTLNYKCSLMALAIWDILEPQIFVTWLIIENYDQNIHSKMGKG